LRMQPLKRTIGSTSERRERGERMVKKNASKLERGPKRGKRKVKTL